MISLSSFIVIRSGKKAENGSFPPIWGIIILVHHRLFDFQPVHYNSTTQRHFLFRESEDVIPTDKGNRVYRINCSDCPGGRGYIGETSCPMKIRVEEHLNVSRFGFLRDSAFADHLIIDGYSHNEESVGFLFLRALIWSRILTERARPILPTCTSR